MAIYRGWGVTVTITALLENLSVSQLVNKFSVFYGKRNFISLLTVFRGTKPKHYVTLRNFWVYNIGWLLAPRQITAPSGGPHILSCRGWYIHYT
jgi:hypothetical protein